jgi:tetratricopeptide (TPR) repeat protein
MTSWRRWLGLTLISTLSIQCFFSSQKSQLQSADKAIADGRPKAALELLTEAAHGDNVGLALEAARKGARLAQVDLKMYSRAIELNHIVIVGSDNSEDRKTAQKNIAQIYFENVLDYEKAIIEYEKLLRLDFSDAEKHQFRLNVAKSQLQLGNFDQALAELDALSKLKNSENEEYDLGVFRANVLISQKKQEQAALVLEGLIKKFPERAEKESLALTLTVCYEELEEFEKAIATLEAMKKGYSHPEFLDARIARLRTRENNRPLANGFKK